MFASTSTLHANPQQALVTPAPAPRNSFDVACIYYPGFHPTPFMESRHGFGWSEWDIASRCRPRFPGHRQPLLPAWGAFDERDPRWAAREVEAAAGAGIDAWIFDWYWYSGVEIWNEALDRGFLHAPNRSRMKFALMWANHTWQDNHPAPAVDRLTDLLPIRHSPEDLERVADEWCRRYFTQPNYWRMDGRPWCSFFLLQSLLDQLGGESGAGAALERFRRRIQANGEADPVLGVFTWSPAEARLACTLGFNTATTYVIPRGLAQRPNQPLVDYANVMAMHRQTWEGYRDCGLPYWPVVSQGWDVSARNDPGEPWPPVKWQWPWGHLVTGNTPERFGELVGSARAFLTTQPPTRRAMVLNAWNEWTEGSVLLPTVDQDDAVLQALASALR